MPGLLAGMATRATGMAIITQEPVSERRRVYGERGLFDFHSGKTHFIIGAKAGADVYPAGRLSGCDFERPSGRDIWTALR